MKAKKLVTVLLGCGMTALMTWAQGSLTPPGAPAPTMKTLAQVEPRTPITNAPYTITQPGSYYLTKNLGSMSHGIVIQTSRVTLDLMGFSLTGDRGSSDSGIWLAGASNAVVRDIVVRNGMVSGFGHGVLFDYTQNSHMEGLVVSSNSSDGVLLNGYLGRCNGNTIAGCTISGSNGYGVNLDGTSGQCNGNTLADCTINGSSGHAVLLNGPSGRCNGNTITDCAISGNGNYGIMIYGYLGQCDGNKVTHCVLRENTDFGIYVYYATGGRIENNHVAGTVGNGTYGIYTAESSANLIVQNMCVGQTNNYFFSPNDTYGPLVTNSGALATTNGAAGLSPWANFSR